MNKMWTSKGEEQQLLEKLFREKEVNVMMKPSEVQQRHQLFHGFSAAVFRKHWNATKLMFTTIAGTSGSCANNQMSEIDGNDPPPAKAAKFFVDDNALTDTIIFKQFPIINTVYTDPETKQDHCFVIISLLPKVKKIDFDIVAVDNDHVLKVTYTWPLDSYKAKTMFTLNSDRTTFVNTLHPKFLAVEKAIQNVRENIEDAPVGAIEIKLQENVQVDPSTWNYYHNRKDDGTLLIFFEIPVLEVIT